MTTLAVRVPRRLRRQIVIRCTENNRTVQSFIEDAVRERLARQHRQVVRA